jgi:hypothetical protein
MRSLPAAVFRLTFFSQFLKKRGQILSLCTVELIWSAKFQVTAKPFAIIDMVLGRARFPVQSLVKQTKNFAWQCRHGDIQKTRCHAKSHDIQLSNVTASGHKVCQESIFCE